MSQEFPLDPTRCNHRGPKPMVGTKFVDNPHRHQIFQLAQCIDCGRILEIPRDVRSAGRSGAIDIDDPRVFNTLKLTKSVEERYFSQFNDDGHCELVQGADLS